MAASCHSRRRPRSVETDPRRSLEKRYADWNGFVTAVRGGTNELVRERFMIREDADKLVKAAETDDVLEKALIPRRYGAACRHATGAPQFRFVRSSDVPAVAAGERTP